MSNFYKKKMAQESANAILEPGSIELPAEAVETHMEEASEDTAEIELLDRDAAVLSDDTDESEEQLDLIDEETDEEGGDEEESEDMTEDEVEALDVAQESTRKRWGLERTSIAQESRGSSRSRRQVARESIVEDIKGLITRFIEWLKEQGRKLKDRWLAFSNAGKTIQSRSKKFEAQLRKLGSKKNDTIKGAFIKQLTIAGTFAGGDMTALKAELTIAKGTQEAQSSIYEFATTAATKLLEGKEVTFAELKQIYKSTGLASERGTNVIGNMTVNSKEDAEEVNIDFIEHTADVASDVPTPSSSQLASANDLYNMVGKDLEKQLQAYHKTNTAREKLEKAMAKILTAVGKKAGEEGGEKPAKHARRVAQKAATSAQTVARIGAHIWKTLPTGINGYLVAGIGAYGK